MMVPKLMRVLATIMAGLVLAGPGSRDYVAHYSAAQRVVLFGAGNNSKDLHRLDAEGNITRLKPAPVEVGINTTVVTSDPVSGDILVLHKDDKCYSLDPVKDAWKELGTEGMPFRMKGSSFGEVATPVSNHGVTLFFTAERRGLKVYLHKHMAPRLGATAVLGAGWLSR